MEPHRRPAGHRLLLPYEIDLCEALGITAEEYWEFIFAAQEHVKERGKEYAHIPDIRNAPVTPILINLVIGVALTAIGTLLAPKPKAQTQRERRRLDIQGSQGATRYTRSNEFNSVQQLANLGQTIPLVFARYDEEKPEYGGVRVDTELLHSQMLTSGTNQLLYAVMMLGMGELGKEPDFDGIAIGDLLLRDFNDRRTALYYSSSKRILDTDRYTGSKLDVPTVVSDAFSVYWPKDESWSPHFSGTRTPSTKTQFGCYGPIPNGHRFHLPLELVMVVDGRGGSNEQSKKDNRKKKKKIGKSYPRLCGLTSQNGRSLTYTIKGVQFESNPDDLVPWGQSDVVSYQNETRQIVDEILQPNQEFIFVSRNNKPVIGRVVSRSVSSDKQDPWDPLRKETYNYSIELDNSVNIATVSGEDLNSGKSNEGGAAPWNRPAIQQVAIAALTNSRPCHATEIGIKSEVWRRISNSVNFNSWPKEDLVRQYEKEGDYITIGQISQYMKRFSFFKIEARALGSERWLDISKARRGGAEVFAVRGSSPTIQYNTIHIDHPGSRASVHEFRITPLPGAMFYDRFNNQGTLTVHLLNGREMYLSKATTYRTEPTDENLSYQVSYTGVQKTLGRNNVTNTEWIIGYEGDLEGREPKGSIEKLKRYQTRGASFPVMVERPDELLQRKYNPEGNLKSCVEFTPSRWYEFFWNGQKLRGSVVPKPNDTTYMLLTTENGQKIRYEAGNVREFGKPGDWSDRNDSPLYSVRQSPLPNPFLDDGYNSCVYVYEYKQGGTQRTDLRYKYKGELVASVRNGSPNTNWIEVNADDPNGKPSRFRYRIQANANGSLSEPVTTSDIRYTNDPMQTDLFEWGSETQPYTGAVKTADGRFSFYRNGSLIGTNSGNGRNYYIDGSGSPGSSNRWRATSLVRPAESASNAAVDRLRECDPNVNGWIAECVTTGFVLLFKDGVPKMGRAYEPGTDNYAPKQLCKMFINGVKVINDQPVEDFYGNLIEYVDPQRNFRYRPYKLDEPNPPYVGHQGVRSPCYRIVMKEMVEEWYEQWAISYQDLNYIATTYYIEKQKLTMDIPDRWRIQKWRYDIVEEDPPVESIVSIRGERVDNEDDNDDNDDNDDDDKPRNTSAKAKLYTYSNNTYQWELTEERGDGYRVGERVSIGKTGEAVEVEGIKTGEAETDEGTSSYGKMTEDSTSEKPNNYSPLNAICDYFINNTDTSSHSNGPEHSVCFCNEIIKQDTDNPPNYENLDLLGIKIANSKEWSSFSNLSAWIKRGIKVERLATNRTGATNLFPEIAYALLTDNKIGAGKAIGPAAVDKNAMTIAAKFCRANNFYWDGVISEEVNLREFIFTNAGYILCDFTIKGGKFALIPAVPYNPLNFEIAPDRQIDIRALYTDGNMKNMQVTFLSPEERQLFKAVVLYRQETVNGFPETRTMTTYLSNEQGGSDVDPIEEFDLTQFCTSETQARWFSRVALKLRQLVDHGISFETTPQSAMTLEPGQYFKVATRVSHTDRFQSGMVDASGNVVSSVLNTSASLNIVYWKPGTTGTREGVLNFTNGKTNQSSLFGTIWANRTDTENTRVYKCETLSYSDDGLVTVSGSYTPLTEANTLAILNYGDNEFIEELA